MKPQRYAVTGFAGEDLLSHAEQLAIGIGGVLIRCDDFKGLKWKEQSAAIVGTMIVLDEMKYSYVLVGTQVPRVLRKRMKHDREHGRMKARPIDEVWWVSALKPEWRDPKHAAYNKAVKTVWMEIRDRLKARKVKVRTRRSSYE